MTNLLQKLNLNEEASAGGLGGLVLVFGFFSFFCIVVGVVMDKYVEVNNSFIGVFPMSQDAINTMTYISWIFKAMPFIFLLFLIVNHIVIANKESSGEV
jgi:hypothetical protein